ncbi:YbeD family protein [Gynuella sp.]|uniref:YbeD family protein n=1 Tax=Gynuella sp. TaxID=2969146 RepID=UPI003D0A686F
MSEPEAPKIEFPCANYVVKVVGSDTGSFREDVLAVMLKYDPKLDQSRIQYRPSSKGTYLSISYWITAESEAQLKTLNEELRSDSRVKTVL